MDNVVNDLTVHQTLANGNAILIFYDIFVLCLFLFEVFLYINREHYKALPVSYTHLDVYKRQG